MITEEGTRALLGFLSGRYPAWAGALVIGISDKPAAFNDTDVGFPVEVAPIDVLVPEQATQSIIARSTFNPNTTSEIYEVALINNPVGYSFQQLLSFDEGDESFTGGVQDTVWNRTGLSSARLTNGGAVVYQEENRNLEQEVPRTRFSMAYMVHSGTGSMRVRIGQDDQNYYEQVLSLNEAGYGVQHWAKSDFVSTGLPRWNELRYFAVDVDPGIDITLDGLCMRAPRDNEQSFMIARRVLAQPIQKVVAQFLDVEYKVRMNFG